LYDEGHNSANPQLFHADYLKISRNGIYGLAYLISTFLAKTHVIALALISLPCQISPRKWGGGWGTQEGSDLQGFQTKIFSEQKFLVLLKYFIFLSILMEKRIQTPKYAYKFEIYILYMCIHAYHRIYLSNIYVHDHIIYVKFIIYQ